MSQHIGHEANYRFFKAIAVAFKDGGYNRCVSAAGETVLFDTKPAPDWVPGVPNKKVTGVDYTPEITGTRGHFVYLSGGKTTEKAKKSASHAVAKGFKRQEYIGNLVSIKEMPDGGVMLMIYAANREDVDDAGNIKPNGKPQLRMLSLKQDASVGGGILVASGLDQMLGIPFHTLDALMESEKRKYWGSRREESPSSGGTMTNTIRNRRGDVLGSGEEPDAGAPAPLPDPSPKGSTGASEPSEAR